MRRRIFFIFVIINLITSVFAYEDIKFRLEDSSLAFEILARKNRIRPLENFQTRLECAREVYDFYQKVLDRKTLISPADYERIETLVEEFKDEITLVKIEQATQELKSSGDVARAMVSGRLATHIRAVSAYPLEEAGVAISPFARLFVINSSKNLWLNVSARSATTLTGAQKMKIDEAHVGYEFGRTGPFGGRLKVGRIYFLLGRLGLIADNNFDTFEGISADLEFLRQGFKIQGIFSRLSSTNYPRTLEFEDCDDYWAARVSKEFGSGAFELGANVLFSGIASEDAASIDMWWRTPLKGRQLVAEYALYRPTKTSIYETTEDPHDVRYYAFVCGFDLINEDNFNVFAQLGDVQKGFAPMATSLAYSAQEHLYFDPDTRGVDISFTYYPSVKDETNPWSTRPSAKNLDLPRAIFYELNTVYLWRSENSQRSQARYVLKHGRPITTDLKLYLENTVWEKEPSDVWVYDKAIYNEAKIFIVYEF